MRKETRSPLQDFIIEAIARRGMTRYALAGLCGWARSDIYRRLRGGKGTESMERMFAALGVTVTAGDRSMRLSFNKRGKVVAVKA